MDIPYTIHCVLSIAPEQLQNMLHCLKTPLNTSIHVYMYVTGWYTYVSLVVLDAVDQWILHHPHLQVSVVQPLDGLIH